MSIFGPFRRKNTAGRPLPSSDAIEKAGSGFVADHAPLIRVATLVVTMVASASLAVVTFLALNAVYAAFLSSATISITDGVFTDWGTTGSPVAGSANVADLSDGSPAPQPSLNLERFWVGFSTADGTLPTTGNLVENFYFRVDTADTDGTLDSNFNIQLNLDAGAAGTADHLIQLRAGEDAVDNPEVEIVLFEYDLPYPNVGAFTTGNITVKVANVTFTGATTDTNATGAIHKHDATKYGFEVKIPISWFSSSAPDYGGKFEADGSGSSSVVTSIFTSTGSLGSVGTPKDVISDADGNTVATVTLTATGGTDSVSLIVTKIGFTTSTQSIVAGSASTVITAQTQDAIGARAVGSDTTIKYSSDSAFGSFSATANGTYTTTLSVTQTADTKTTSVFYKDTVSGTPTITAAEDPAASPDWTNATQAQTVTPGPLTSVTLTPSTSAAEVVEDQTFVFVTTNPIPIDGKIVLTFPTGFTVSSGSATTLVSENFSGTASVTNISGQAVTITRAGGNILAAGSWVTLIFNNVKNPVAATITGTYQIKTTISGGTTIDQFTGVRSIPSNVTNVSSAPLANVTNNRSSTASITSSVVPVFPRGATASITSGFKNNLTLPRGGTVSVTSTLALNFPRSSGLTYTDSIVLAPGKNPVGTVTFSQSIKQNVGANPSTSVGSGSALVKTSAITRSSAASISDTNVLTFPRGATTAITSAFRRITTARRAATVNSESAALGNLSLPRSATANVSDTFAPTFGRGATASISSSVLPTFPRGATANITTTFLPKFLRGATTNVTSNVDTTIVQVGVQDVADTFTATDSAVLGFPSAGTANISSSFLTKFPRSATANVSDTFAPSFPRSATANISDTFSPRFPRSATANISSAVLPKFLRGATANISDKFSVSFPRNTAATANVSDTFAPSFPRSATANISDTFSPRFPRSATANISSAVLPKFLRGATANISDKFSVGFPRPAAATANVSDTFVPRFPRAATANISDTFAPSFPRSATANIRSAALPRFPRAATANISDSVLPKFPRAAKTNISDTFLPKFLRSAKTNISDAVVPKFLRSAKTNISDTLKPNFLRSSTVTAADSHNLAVVVIGDLTVTDVEPESLTVSIVGDVDVSFKLANALPANGKIVITLPSGFTINSGATTAIGADGTSFDGNEVVSVSGQVITITRSGGSSLNAGTSVTIELTNIKNSGTAGSTGTYGIKTTNSGGTSIDDDNAVSADTLINTAGAAKKAAPTADLGVTHSGSTSQSVVGQNRTYTFVVTNNGKDNVSGAKLVNPLPSQVSLVSATTTRGSCSGTTTVTCSLGSFGASQTATVTIVVKVNTAGTLVSKATVSGEQNDTTSSNNSFTVTTTAIAALTAAVSYQPEGSPKAGDTVVITVTFNRTVTGTPTISIDTPGVDQSSTALTASSDGKVWTYSYKAPEGSDGQATVSVGGLGTQTGGVALTLTNNKFTIKSDGQAVALTYDVKEGASAGDKVVITATFDKTITGTPTIAIDTTGTDLAAVTMTKTSDAKVWTYEYTVPTGSDGEAKVTIAGAKDQSGNANKLATNNKFQIGPKKISVTLSYQPEENIRPGTTVVITAKFDKSFTGPASVTFDTSGTDLGPVVMTVSSDALVWTYSYVVPAGIERSVAVKVTGPASASDSQKFTITNGSFTISGDTADLSVGVTANSDTIVRRGELTYTITVANRGPETATGVTLVNELPGGVNIDSVNPGTLECSVASGTVTCDIGTLASGSGVVVLIDVTVRGDAEGTLVNNSGISGSPSDSDSTNNVDTAETQVIIGVLSYVVSIADGDLDNTGIVLTDSPDPVFLCNDLTYDLDVSNTGDSPATDVNLIVSLPSAVTFASAFVELNFGGNTARNRPADQPGTAPKIASLLAGVATAVGECTEADGTVICALGELQPGQVARVTIIVEPVAAGILNNQATPVLEGQDPETTGKIADESTTVMLMSDLNIALQDVSTSVSSGDRITFDYLITNQGPSDATGILLSESLLAGLQLVPSAADPSSCTVSSGELTCQIGNLASGESRSMSLTLAIDPSVTGDLVNIAEVAGAQADFETEDNTVSSTISIMALADLSLT